MVYPHSCLALGVKSSASNLTHPNWPQHCTPPPITSPISHLMPDPLHLSQAHHHALWPTHHLWAHWMPAGQCPGHLDPTTCRPVMVLPMIVRLHPAAAINDFVAESAEIVSLSPTLSPALSLGCHPLTCPPALSVHTPQPQVPMCCPLMLTCHPCVSRIYSTALLILLQHPVLQYFLLYIEQKLYGPLWVPLVLYSYLVMIS